MIKISCPDDNRKERTYIIETLVQEFLGLSFELAFDKEADSYSFTLENGNGFIIQDHFFSRFPKPKSYLQTAYLPVSVEFIDDPSFGLQNLPVIYGKPDVDKLLCRIDLFASSFFMLTRWEEYVSDRKDHLGRFRAVDALAYRFGFLDRPVVNEYTDLLWKLLEMNGINQKRKARKFKVYLTHDVDFVLKWYSTTKFFRALAGDLFKRRSIKHFLGDIVDFNLYRRGRKEDPFNTFDELMSQSESLGLVSYFFFMSVEPKRKKKHFSLEHPFVRGLIAEIHRRGHRIGFHPDIGSFRDPERWMRERDRLTKVSPQPVTSGRQHFLQFEVPDTWQLWDDMNMEWDSSLTYDTAPGFRAGCCYSYHVFNILSQRRLSLIERPLTIMDKTLIDYFGEGNTEGMKEGARKLVEEVRSHHGDFVLLWHNNCFNVEEWRHYKHLYPVLLDCIRENLVQ